jgi:type IV pilus assembly protein PilE
MKSKGFTLIELLVAVMIVGILSAVAVSSYQDYITRANRADAKAVLMEVAGWMERNYSATGSYNTNPAGGAITTPPVTQSPKTGSPHYCVAFSSISAIDFTVQAVPDDRDGACATPPVLDATADTECGTLSLSSLGVQTESGTGDVAACWQR